MTREKAINVLEDALSRAVFMDDIDVLEMAISALREQPQWISVADRFPEHGTVALVWDGKFRKVGRFSKKYGWHEEYEPHDENGGVFLCNITHWMPLPSFEEDTRVETG